jgi:hypothetical protein
MLARAQTSSPPPGRPSRADMLETAIGGVLANKKALEAAQAGQKGRKTGKGNFLTVMKNHL